ncbi:UNVERIFIED_CONTAM: hypothetical protein FKN15_062892 [Acipenser sinensis]
MSFIPLCERGLSEHRVCYYCTTSVPSVSRAYIRYVQTCETPAIIRKITSIKFSIQVQVAVNGSEAKEKAQAEPVQTCETPAIIRKITSIKFSIQVQVAVNGSEAKEKAQAEPDASRSGSVTAYSALCVTFWKEQRAPARYVRCEYRSVYTAYWEPSKYAACGKRKQAMRALRYRSTREDATQSAYPDRVVNTHTWSAQRVYRGGTEAEAAESGKPAFSTNARNYNRPESTGGLFLSTRSVLDAEVLPYHLEKEKEGDLPVSDGFVPSVGGTKCIITGRGLRQL